MLRVENPKHEKNEVLRMVEFQRSETGKERSSSKDVGPGPRSHGGFERPQALRRRTSFFDHSGAGRNNPKNHILFQLREVNQRQGRYPLLIFIIFFKI
jgi:hypothetical protein